VGQEARCTARLGESVSEGKALLETDSLLFRGAFRLEIPFSDMRSVESREGKLTVAFSKGWAERIRNPRTLVDKLGIKPGFRVGLVGCDADFAAVVRERTFLVSEGDPADGSDLVFLQADSVADLRRVAALAPRLQPAGAIWVIGPKGGREPTEAQVLAAGRAAGLVDTKVVRFSDTHTAHRFSIPKASR